MKETLKDIYSKDRTDISDYMGILPDYILENMHRQRGVNMIKPFFDKSIKVNEKGEKITSYGSSSYGYDIRTSDKFKIYCNVNAVLNDPKAIKEENFVEVTADHVIIPPNAYMLCHSMEEFDLPSDVTGVAVGKSTLARAGLIVNVTPLEAGWKGYLTIEVANGSPLPAKVYAFEGICQILFFKGLPCRTSYADRGGKYQNQGAEIVLPKL